MELVLALITFAALWDLSRGQVQCYKCEPVFLSNGGVTNLCQDFDYGQRFQVNCPSSSMCYKMIINAEIGDAVTTSIQRGCALQIQENEQVKIEKKWKLLHTIHEVYSEDCQQEDTDGAKATSNTICYCRGDYCNSGTIVGLSGALVTFTLLFLFVVKS